jgi:hypothetical protein
MDANNKSRKNSILNRWEDSKFQGSDTESDEKNLYQEEKKQDSLEMKLMDVKHLKKNEEKQEISSDSSSCTEEEKAYKQLYNDAIKKNYPIYEINSFCSIRQQEDEKLEMDPCNWKATIYKKDGDKVLDRGNDSKIKLISGIKGLYMIFQYPDKEVVGKYIVESYTFPHGQKYIITKNNVCSINISVAPRGRVNIHFTKIYFSKPKRKRGRPKLLSNNKELEDLEYLNKLSTNLIEIAFSPKEPRKTKRRKFFTLNMGPDGKQCITKPNGNKPRSSP